MTKEKKSGWRTELGVKCQVQMRIIPAVAQASEKGSEPLVQSVEALDNEIQCGSLLSLPHLCGYLERLQDGACSLEEFPLSRGERKGSKCVAIILLKQHLEDRSEVEDGVKVDFLRVPPSFIWVFQLPILDTHLLALIYQLLVCNTC